MITGEIKNKIDQIWDTFFVAGITNPITVLEQMTYIFFMKMLDDKQLQEEENARDWGAEIQNPTFLDVVLPVMADFSFGGKKLRAHAYAGVYGAFWMKARTEGTTFWMTDYCIYFNDFNKSRPFNSEDRRLTAGGVGGLGVSYAFPNVWKKVGGPVVTLDALYYYDFVSHHKGHPHLSDPRYLSTLSITLGVAVCF